MSHTMRHTCFFASSFSLAAAGIVEIECRFGAIGGFASSEIFPNGAAEYY